MFCWNAQDWSLQVSWTLWSSCPDLAAPYAPSLCLRCLISEDTDYGACQNSAHPPRVFSSGWWAKMRRATASKGCPVSPTPTSFQARQPPPSRHISPKQVCLVSHTSSKYLLTFHLLFFPCVGPPVVSMPDVVKGFYMQPAVIGCSVESAIPYKLRFTRNGISVGVEKFFQWVVIWLMRKLNMLSSKDVCKILLSFLLTIPYMLCHLKK